MLKVLFTTWLFINKWQMCPNKEGLSISEDNWWLPLPTSEVKGILNKIAKIYWLRKLLPSLFPVSHGRRLPLTTQQMKA